MTHLFEGMKGKTRGGYEFEIFAKRGDYWYGCSQCAGPRNWAAMRWEATGESMSGTCYDIFPPPPVKKWKWIMRSKKPEPDFMLTKFVETAEHYATAADAEAAYPGWTAYQRVEASEVCE